MTDDVVPVLWLSGPRGVGKSTVGWKIYAEVLRSGIDAAYVDIDQLGMCYPEQESDPGRHRMKERNLDAVITTFRQAGARCVVVSGVVDPVDGVHIDELPHAALTLCRLRADTGELKQRYLGRGADLAYVDQALRDADDLDAGTSAEMCIDTTSLAVAEVAQLVRERIGWPVLAGPPTAAPQSPPTAGADGPILWVCGPAGVGTSTIGFAVYLRALDAGLTVAYVDAEQVGFCGPGPADDLVSARNVAALWRTYRAVGAQALVVVGPIQNQSTIGVYADALGPAVLTVCRLHAGRERLTERVLSRGRGESWPQPGDPLRGLSVGELLRVADRSVAEDEALERAGVGVRIDTDGRSVAESADAILNATRWLRAGE